MIRASPVDPIIFPGPAYRVVAEPTVPTTDASLLRWDVGWLLMVRALRICIWLVSELSVLTTIALLIVWCLMLVELPRACNPGCDGTDRSHNRRFPSAMILLRVCLRVVAVWTVPTTDAPLAAVIFHRFFRFLSSLIFHNFVFHFLIFCYIFFYISTRFLMFILEF